MELIVVRGSTVRWKIGLALAQKNLDFKTLHGALDEPYVCVPYMSVLPSVIS